MTLKNIHRKLDLLRNDLLPLLSEEALNIQDLPHRDSYDVDDLLVYIRNAVIVYLKRKEKMKQCH